MFEFLKNLGKREEIPTVKPIGQQVVLNNWLSDCNYSSRYRTLADCPEIKGAVEKIAEIISTMTIHQMKNTENGDVRVIDGLSKLIDIKPNNNTGRQAFVSWIVQEMLLNGNAVVIPRFKNGYIDSLNPIPNSRYTFEEKGNTYCIRVGAENKTISPDKFLHFRFNPDLNKSWLGQSQSVIMQDLMNNLSQARDTVTDFMTNKTMPGVIIKVDALSDELETEAGRDEIERRFLTRSKNGQPWIIPADLIDVQQIKPITLKEIAIHEQIEITKETAAAILGVPAFLLGIGEFKRDEYNNFIRTKIAVICKAIEEELTNKLLLDPDRYFKFNRKSMLNYDLKELGALYTDLCIKGIVTRNEVRDVLGMSPLDGLDELIILENYIPSEKIGDQSKLKGGD